MPSSALTPSDAPVVRGAIAMMGFLHARHFTLPEGIVLLSLMERPGQSMGAHEVGDALALDFDSLAHPLMVSLSKKGAVTVERVGTRDARITLTESGAVDIMSMLGAAMLSGHDS